MRTPASYSRLVFPILRATGLASTLLAFTGCVPVSTEGYGGSSGAKLSPEEQVKQILALDGTTQDLDLQINEVTSWSGSGWPSNPRKAYDAIYDTAVGGEGVPVKGTITSVSSSGGMTTLSCSVSSQNSEMPIGNDYSGAASMTLKINPSRRKFAVVFPSSAGMLWKSGKQVQFMFGHSGEVVQIQDTWHDNGYQVSGAGAYVTLAYRGESVSEAANLSIFEAYNPGMEVPRGYEYTVLRNGKWCGFNYEKGPGGSGVSWVIKKVKPR